MRALLLILFAAQTLCAQVLILPPRPADALSGSEFAKSIETLEQKEREEKIFQEVAKGNLPDFFRKFVPITTQAVIDGKTNSATYFVAPDYLAIGSDTDYFMTPLSPITAQRVADLLHCSLPTRKMVDDIYAHAAVKLSPSNIPPSKLMTTVPVFVQHNQIVRSQRSEQLVAYPLGELVAGDKKDIVVSKKLVEHEGRVVIYGWHNSDGKAIQPLYAGHADYWADYSHGIRLVQLALVVNESPRIIPEILADPNLAALLSDEGPILIARYPTNFMVRAATSRPKLTNSVINVPETK